MFKQGNIKRAQNIAIDFKCLSRLAKVTFLKYTAIIGNKAEEERFRTTKYLIDYDNYLSNV